MIARMLNVQVPPERCAERIDFYTGLLKQAEGQDGCEQALLLGDDDTGEVVLMTVWSDQGSWTQAATLSRSSPRSASSPRPPYPIDANSRSGTRPSSGATSRTGAKRR